MTTPHHVRPPHHELPRGHRYDGVGHDATHTPRPRLSTAPPGLFAPAPEVVAEKVVKPPKPKRIKPASQRPPRPIAACGTVSGYSRHRRLKEEVCEPCRLANREHKREYNRKHAKSQPTRVRKQYVRGECGSESGYSAHRTHKERICDACREAHNGKQRDRRRVRAAAVGQEMQPVRQAIAACGTSSGYKRHRRNGEQSCEPCLIAKRADDKRQRAGQRAA